MEKILLTAFFTCFSIAAFAQIENAKTFDLESPAPLLSLFFDSDTVSSTGEALWKPLTYDDEISANLSDDGWMHTRLDTLLFYTNYEIDRAVAVFETLHYEQGEIKDCPSCGALISVAIFDKTANGKWVVASFDKHFISLGGDGHGGQIGLTQFGVNQTCLSMKMDWMGQGVHAEYLSILNLEDMEKVFNLVVHEDNKGVLGGDFQRTYSFDKSIQLLQVVETVTGWWDFDLVTQGTQPDKDVNRALPANMVERYEFNWETGTYLKVCK
jgi:hypothetical protein